VSNVSSFGSPVVVETNLGHCFEFSTVFCHCQFGGKKDIWPINACAICPKGFVPKQMEEDNQAAGCSHGQPVHVRVGCKSCFVLVLNLVTLRAASS